jgi:3',5'-cyclic-AMP phosphodiesterase
VGIAIMDAMGFANPDAFWEVVMPHRARIRLIAFGHLHRPISGVWYGIPFACCPSTAHQVALELGPRPAGGLNFNHEPPCYAVMEVGEAGVIVHQQRYAENWKFAPRPW